MFVLQPQVKPQAAVFPTLFNQEENSKYSDAHRKTTPQRVNLSASSRSLSFDLVSGSHLSLCVLCGGCEEINHLDAAQTANHVNAVA